MKRAILGPILSMSVLILAGTTLAGDGDLIINGKAGIGTTNPSAPVTIEAGNSHGPLSILDDSSTYLALGQWKSNGGHDYRIGIDGSTMWFGAYNNYRWYRTQTGDVDMVLSNGNVGIATTNPYRKLSISGQQPLASYTSDYNNVSTGSLFVQEFGASSGNTYTMLGALTAGGSQWGNLILQPGGSVGIGTTSPGGYKLYVNGNVFATGGYYSSDARLKKNIRPLADSTSLVKALQPVVFDWRIDEFPEKEFESNTQIGLIAQDVEKVVPELVRTDDDGYKAISYEKLTAILVEAVREQQHRIEKLEAQLDEMMNR